MNEPNSKTCSRNIKKFISDLGDWKRSHDNGQPECRRHGQGRLPDGLGAISPRSWRLFLPICGIARTHPGCFRPRSAPNPEEAHILRSEYVIAIRGTVRERPEGMTNPALPTGARSKLWSTTGKLLNTSKTPPFPNEDRVDARGKPAPFLALS